MLQALLKGKLSRYFTSPPFEIEDLLTSVAFGSFEYVRPEQGLLPFIDKAINSNHEYLGDQLRDVVEVEPYEFWKHHKEKSIRSCLPYENYSGDAISAAASEPELILRFRCKNGSRKLLLVEVKLHSGKSSMADPSEIIVADQLAKYWLHLERDAADEGALPVGILYVTSGLKFPREDFEETQKELVAKTSRTAPLYWTSWRFLADCMPLNAPKIIVDLVELFRIQWQLANTPMETWPEPPSGIAYRFHNTISWPSPWNVRSNLLTTIGSANSSSFFCLTWRFPDSPFTKAYSFPIMVRIAGQETQND